MVTGRDTTGGTGAPARTLTSVALLRMESVWQAAVARVRATAARHPRIVDALVAGPFVLAATAMVAAEPDAAPWPWLWLIALSLPLIWRRAAPALVFWLLAGGTLAYELVPGDRLHYPEFLVMVALYGLARHGTRRRVWIAAAGCELAIVADLWGEPAATFVAGLLFQTCALLTVVLLGSWIATRRAYLSELEERARRLQFESDQQSKLAVAAERARIAREMHDIVAHNLTVMVALADGAAFVAPGAPDRAADTMLQVSATGRQALGEMRRLLGLLHDGPPGAGSGLAPQPGFDDLDNLVAQVRSAGLPVAFTRQGTPGAWGPGAGLTVYRIVQEGLTNTLKHAGTGATAEVILHFDDHGVRVDVRDDGAGSSRAATRVESGGDGITGMTARASSYGGTVHAGPRAGAGWQVTAQLRFDGMETT